MNMLSVGTYGPPDVFNRCPSTELSLEAESRQNSVSHCERTGARGQFKIVSFSQEWFFPEASCCFNLKKAASSSLLSRALCLHTPYLFAAPGCEHFSFELGSLSSYLFGAPLLTPPALHFTILSLGFPFSYVLCFLIDLCCGNQRACMPGDVSQLHPKPVPG